MSTPEQPTLPTPTVEQHDRMTRVLWPVGEPDAEGFQLYMALTVQHYGRAQIAGWPEHQYRAHLKHAQIKRREDGGTSETISVLSGAGFPVDSLHAPRFSRPRLASFTAACQAAVERRYTDGDHDFVGLMRGAVESERRS